MSWQDAVLSIGGFVFTASLIPTLRDRRRSVPLLTSAGTGAALVVYTIALGSLGLQLAAAATALNAVAWFLVAAYRRAA